MMLAYAGDWAMPTGLLLMENPQNSGACCTGAVAGVPFTIPNLTHKRCSALNSRYGSLHTAVTRSEIRPWHEDFLC
jgi:hypothetical protein